MYMIHRTIRPRLMIHSQNRVYLFRPQIENLATTCTLCILFYLHRYRSKRKWPCVVIIFISIIQIKTLYDDHVLYAFLYFYHTNQNIVWQPCALCISLFLSCKSKRCMTTMCLMHFFISIIQIQNVVWRPCAWCISLFLSYKSKRCMTTMCFMHFFISIIQIQNVANHVYKYSLILLYKWKLLATMLYFYHVFCDTTRKRGRPWFPSIVQILENSANYYNYNSGFLWYE